MFSYNNNLKERRFFVSMPADVRYNFSFLNDITELMRKVELSQCNKIYFSSGSQIIKFDKLGAAYLYNTLIFFARNKSVLVDKNLYQRVESYLLNLESRGRYTLTIWPPHCLFATPGACINEDIRAAAHTWEKEVPGRSINFVVKAANPLTEHYSAIQAEVPDPADPTTKTNFTLIEKLKHKHIAVVGEALSHCVSNTIRDLCIYIPPEQITLVTDCTSNVAGFEYIGKEFLETYTARGMNTIVSTDPVQ